MPWSTGRTVPDEPEKNVANEKSSPAKLQFQPFMVTNAD